MEQEISMADWVWGQLEPLSQKFLQLDLADSDENAGASSYASKNPNFGLTCEPTDASFEA